MNMKSIILLAIISLSLLAFGVRAEEMHMKEALKHAEAATNASDGKSVAKHAEQSKIHAKVTEEHLVAGMTSLDSAIEKGNAGNTDNAKKAAEEALTHLKAAQ